MRFFGNVSLCLLLLVHPSYAWDATGHRIIAFIAYERLTPHAKARVDALLQHHPDYALLIRNAGADPAERAREAFLAAAVWPDTIKGDRRFWDDTRQDAQPTAVLPGFPDMKRHTNWHYFDLPFNPDGAHAEKQHPPSALSELPRLLNEIAKAADATAAYDLPWIEHIEGDVHQPLHCISRTLKSQPKGDAGGNGVIVGERRNLHSLWDDSCGTDVSFAYVSKYAQEVTAEHPAPKKLEKNPKKWIQEGAKIAVVDVYTFGNETGSREHPLHLPEGYTEHARIVARAQIATAGYRLAAVLNDRLNNNGRLNNNDRLSNNGRLSNDGLK